VTSDSAFWTYRGDVCPAAGAVAGDHPARPPRDQIVCLAEHNTTVQRGLRRQNPRPIGSRRRDDGKIILHEVV
jgi:hypothetical protein